MVVWVLYVFFTSLHFTSPHLLTCTQVQVSPLNRNGSTKEFMQLLPLLCSYLLRESISSHPAGSSVSRHLHSCPGPGEINFLFTIHRKLSGMFSLPDAFPGSLLRREDPVWRLLRLGPEVLLLESEQPQAIPVIQCAVSIRKWQAQTTSFLIQGTGVCPPDPDFFF